MRVMARPPVYRGIKTKTNVWRGVTAALHDNPQEVCMTMEELEEGLDNLRWLQQNGGKLIDAMLNPTWPQRGDK